MALVRHQDRIVCINSSFIWDRQESCADTCLKKIAHFFLIYNGFLMSGRRFPPKSARRGDLRALAMICFGSFAAAGAALAIRAGCLLFLIFVQRSLSHV